MFNVVPVLIIILVGHVDVLKHIDGPSNKDGYVIGLIKLPYCHQTHFLQGNLWVCGQDCYQMITIFFLRICHLIRID